MPEPPFLDRDAAVAARQRFLEDWSDESLYWYAMALRWSDANTEATTTQVVGSISVPAALRPVLKVILRRQIRGQARAQGLARLPLETIVDELGRRFVELLVWLGDRPYFFADRPSVADLALFGQLNALQSGPTPQAGTRLAQRIPRCSVAGSVCVALEKLPQHFLSSRQSRMKAGSPDTHVREQYGCR